MVELLVVIGIIALLISILLPSLSRARESANRIKCLSNLRQISMAMYMYTNENNGYFPGGSRNGYQMYNDYINWQQPSSLWNTSSGQTIYSPSGAQGLPTRYLDEGSIQKYLGGKHIPPPAFVPGSGSSVSIPQGSFNAALWTCPSDDPMSHTNILATRYLYSYTINYLLESNADAYTDLTWMGGVAKMSRVRHPSDTILMVEEGSQTIDDGLLCLCANPGGVSGSSSPPVPGPDFLSVRHDRSAKQPDNPDSPGTLTGNDAVVGILNSRAKGNVSFCDGHADYVTREFVHSATLRKWDPAH